MLTTRYKQVFNRLLDPLASAIGKAGVSPSAITLATPVLTLLVCLWFVQTRRIVPFCLAMLVVGCLDGLDGAVARATGRATKFGAYLDALCDRYVEVLVALAAATVTGYWLLISLTISGALLVSYAKSRAATEVTVTNLEWPDLMERTERSVIFLGGLAGSALIPWRPLGQDLFWWTLLIVAILTHLTVLQRILRARQFILDRS